MELVVHDVVEQILKTFPPKSLLRFKSVSKQWKSTIEFQHKHLTHQRQKSKNPDLLLINTDDKDDLKILERIITLELESSIYHKIPIPWENNLYIICESSCDGLICFYDDYNSVIIFNPATRWYRTLPRSTYQQKSLLFSRPLNPLGFGKDQINGLYKPVWLHNSLESNSANATICEMFDFNINAWRFVEPSSPHRILYWDHPVYLNGLLYWLSEGNEETIKSVLSFARLHLEIHFFLISMIIYVDWDYKGDIEVIWWLNVEEKTWKKLYTIDLLTICPCFEECFSAIWPVALMGEKNKLMLYGYDSCFGRRKQQLMIYDGETTSTHEVFTGGFSTKPVCYFQSLISIL